MKKILVIFLAAFCLSTIANAQDANVLLQRVKAKLNLVNNYVATGKMKTDVAFIKAPPGNVKVYFKKPDRFMLKRENGISILPKSGVSYNPISLLSGESYTAIPSGTGVVNGTKVTMIKLLPASDNSNIVLTTLYIDAAQNLILKSATTTRENGTFEMQMTYGKYAAYGLPDKVILLFNAKDYKIPKGVTLEYDTGDAKKQDPNKKGRVEIDYTLYQINKGVADAEFAK